MTRKLLLSVLIWAISLTAALAQGGGPPTPLPVSIFWGTTATLAATTSSSRVAIPTGLPASMIAVQVLNDSANEAFVALGGSSVAATTASLPLPPGGAVCTYIGASTNVAAIMGTGTGNIRVTPTNGLLCNSGGGTGITGGGSVNQGTSPWVTSDTSTFASAPSATVTRPANTTTYTALTGWCSTTSACATVFTFAGACRTNGSLVLLTNVEISSSINPALKLTGVLWLFSATPGTVISDNAAFSIAAADFANLVGGFRNGQSFSLASAQAAGAANSGVTLQGVNAEIACAGGSTTLYGMVEVTDAYVPGSGEVLTVSPRFIGLN